MPVDARLRSGERRLAGRFRCDPVRGHPPQYDELSGTPRGSAMAAKQPAMSPSDLPVADVLDRVTGPRRAEAEELLALFTEISGEQPVVWAGRILGFGEVEYRYESGRSGRTPLL